MNEMGNTITQRTGLSRSYVSMILNGHRKPNGRTARLFERATGIHRLHWLYPEEFDEGGQALHSPEEGQATGAEAPL